MTYTVYVIHLSLVVGPMWSMEFIYRCGISNKVIGGMIYAVYIINLLLIVGGMTYSVSIIHLSLVVEPIVYIICVLMVV